MKQNKLSFYSFKLCTTGTIMALPNSKNKVAHWNFSEHCCRLHNRYCSSIIVLLLLKMSILTWRKPESFKTQKSSKVTKFLGFFVFCEMLHRSYSVSYYTDKIKTLDNNVQSGPKKRYVF